MTRSSLNGLQNRPPSKILQTNFYLKQENWNLGGTWLLDIQKVCRIECFLKMDLLWLLCKPLYTVRLILQWVFCFVVDEHQYSQLPSFQDIYLILQQLIACRIQNFINKIVQCRKNPFAIQKNKHYI